MIRINNLKISLKSDAAEIKGIVATKLRIDADEIGDIKIIKRSLDARKHPEIFYVYSLDVCLKGGGKNDRFEKNANLKSEAQLVRKLHNPNIVLTQDTKYHFPYSRDDVAGKMKHYAEDNNNRPVVVGFGPSGIFAALMLAECGLNPIVIERGDCVEKRQARVDEFWNCGKLDTESNVQFGEGGAGTFSDGKLNTGVKDKYNRIGFVLEKFIEAGAPVEIGYLNKPHIGTDVLCDVVRNMRRRIISLGGEIRFNTRLDDVCVRDGRLEGIVLSENGLTGRKTYSIETNHLVLAIGHSARDTFVMLKNYVDMVAKSFAVGVRIQHPQELIDKNAYGAGYRDYPFSLPAADYKLTYQTKFGRGVYSFCMCPGGYVVNASSENEMLAVNGMSYSARDGVNANSALIVTVSPRDYANMNPDGFATSMPDWPAAGFYDGKDQKSSALNDLRYVDPLSGLEFQRRLESLAYREGNGKIPLQLLADFMQNLPSNGAGSVSPMVRGGYSWCNVRNALPDFIGDSIAEGMSSFDRYISGYYMEDAIMAGVESRTSSPVRIMRNNETMQSSVAGLYPCGEGAGYAGGITSAALDGIKVAEKLVEAVLQI